MEIIESKRICEDERDWWVAYCPPITFRVRTIPRCIPRWLVEGMFRYGQRHRYLRVYSYAPLGGDRIAFAYRGAYAAFIRFATTEDAILYALRHPSAIVRKSVTFPAKR